MIQKDNALQQKDALIRELQTRLMQYEQKWQALGAYCIKLTLYQYLTP